MPFLKGPVAPVVTSEPVWKVGVSVAEQIRALGIASAIGTAVPIVPPLPRSPPWEGLVETLAES